MDSLGMRQNEYTPELWDTLVIRLTLGSYRFDVSSRAGRCEVDEFADEIVAAMWFTGVVEVHRSCQEVLQFCLNDWFLCDSCASFSQCLVTFGQSTCWGCSSSLTWLQFHTWQDFFWSGQSWRYRTDSRCLPKGWPPQRISHRIAENISSFVATCHPTAWSLTFLGRCFFLYQCFRFAAKQINKP